MNRVNLTESNRDYSVFLPSISTFYNNYIANQRRNPDYVPQSRIPAGFENGIEGCNYLNADQGYYTYKWSLYSAGHAQLNLDKADQDDSMVQERDRPNTFILGDSGGFQILKGVIQCDWPNFKNDHSLRQKILNWLEHTADYSMILDVPTLAAEPTFSERTGITSFNECLDYTQFNNDWFVKNRLGKTKYLNVMQGRNKDEAAYWYEQMKHYPFEGFAFGGSSKNDINIVLRTLIKMRDDKMLERGERDLLHYLGISKLDWSVAYTAIKRALREHVNPDMEVTFDCASPFIATAKGQMYTQHVHRNDRFGYIMDSAIDDKRLSGSTIPFPWSSPMGNRMTLGDICHYGHGTPNMEAIMEDNVNTNKIFTDPEILNNPKYWTKMGDINKINKVGKTSWDSFSYFLLMGHNVYQHIESVQRANALVDAAAARFDTNHLHWTKTSKAKKGEAFDPWVPANSLYMVNFIDKLFRSETPMTMLDEAGPMLSNFSSGRPASRSAVSSFNDLFDTDTVVQDDFEGEFSSEDEEAAESFLESL